MKKLFAPLLLVLLAVAPAADAGSGSGSDAGSAAGSAATAPVSVDSPDFLDRLVSLWRSGAGFPTAVLLLFGLAMFARRRFAWLNQDHYAAYTAAVVAGLGKLADIAATGVTPNQNAIIGAFAGVWLLLMQPKPAQKDAEKKAAGTIPPELAAAAKAEAPDVPPTELPAPPAAP